jgi:hypothetical protein
MKPGQFDHRLDPERLAPDAITWTKAESSAG